MSGFHCKIRFGTLDYEVERTIFVWAWLFFVITNASNRRWHAYHENDSLSASNTMLWATKRCSHLPLCTGLTINLSDVLFGLCIVNVHWCRHIDVFLINFNFGIWTPLLLPDVWRIIFVLLNLIVSNYRSSNIIEHFRLCK